MLLEIHDNLGHPQQIRCSRILVRESGFGNPVAVIIEHAPTHVWISTAGDDNFQRALKLMGIDNTVMNFGIDNAATDGKASLVVPAGALAAPARPLLHRSDGQADEGGQ